VSAPSEVPTIEQFAQQLQTLRIDCGEPSYGAISREMRQDKESLSTGSISTLLGGKRLTKAGVVRGFVRGVLRYRDGEERPEHAEVVAQWFDLWRAMRLASKTAVVDSDASPPETEPEPPVEKPTVPLAYRQNMPQWVRPPGHAFAAPSVRTFNELVKISLEYTDEQGRQWGSAKFGVYAFYDYDGEPIYVGQTNEQLRTRVRRHLTNQRTDAVAMRMLDVREVAEMELWPLWEYESIRGRSDGMRAAQQHLDSVEYTVYARSLAQNRLGALLNEKIPPVRKIVELPPSRRFALLDHETREEWGAPAVRIARRAATLERLTDVMLNRGAVSDGLRRVVVVQAARLTQLAASLCATASGLPYVDIRIDGLDTLTRLQASADEQD
jgi:hypothetical protein